MKTHQLNEITLERNDEQEIIKDIEKNGKKTNATENEEIPTLTYGYPENQHKDDSQQVDQEDNIDDIDKLDLPTMSNPIEPRDPIEDEMTIQPEEHDEIAKYFDLPHDIPTYEKHMEEQVENYLDD